MAKTIINEAGRSEFLFGKHRGTEVIEVCEIDPAYITWCLENVDGFELTPEETDIYAALHDRMPEVDYDESIYDLLDLD